MFIQIVLGLAVFADVAAIKTIGATLAVIPVWMLVYHPGPKALYAAQQQRLYESLCTQMGTMTDETLSSEYARIGERNSEVADFICKAAENALHINANSEAPHKLSRTQKLLLLIAGS